MTANPVVSIITIFLNSEKFLQEAIESVQAQTYPDWELLLIDDGSTDGSTSLARHLADAHPGKISYFDHEGHRNLGKSVSRNLGIENAAGQYLVFLDADDVLLPHKLERQVALLEEYSQAAMVYGQALYWYSWTGNNRDRKRDFPSKLGIQPGVLFEPPYLLTRYLLDGGIVPCLCSPLVRHEVAVEVGGFDESFRHLYEDQVFLAKICLRGLILVDRNIGERYRQHPDSSSYLAEVDGNYDPYRPNRSRLAFLDWLSQYLFENGFDDPTLMKAMQKAYQPFRHPRMYHVLALIQALMHQASRHMPKN